MNDNNPYTDEFSIQQGPAGQGRTLLSLPGQLDVAVASLLVSWTGDICAAPLLDVQLDLRGVTPTDRASAEAPAAAWEYLQLHCPDVDVLGVGPEAGAVIDALGSPVTGRRMPPGPGSVPRVTTSSLARADGAGQKPWAAGGRQGGDCS